MIYPTWICCTPTIETFFIPADTDLNSHNGDDDGPGQYHKEVNFDVDSTRSSPCR